MRPLTAVEMLNSWERAYSLGSARRALAILCAASPDEPPEMLAGLSVGARDARLMTLREWFFGPAVESQTACPGCGEKIESSFELCDVRTSGGEAAGPYEFTFEGSPVVFRLPDSTDLEAIEQRREAGDARRLLLERCVLQAPEDLSGRADAELVKRMGELDPQANIRLAMECPACGQRWPAIFDIAAFFWQEIHAWAQRMLREVHALALAYGWSERDILSMSAARRAIYLEMVGQ
jgi:hypothetical protein